MAEAELNVVTGAFSFTGRYITQRLLLMGNRVRTLTGHPDRPNPFRQQIEVASFNFDKPAKLVKSLEGATTLYNTYWVRFGYREVTFETAVANSKKLIQAAAQARVGKIVHISIANASQDLALPYYRGKAAVEKAITESQLRYAIIRPTVIFGVGDILINNIAWLLRLFPVFAVPGRGDYRLQPVSAEDVAELSVNAAGQDANGIIDAAGPEIFTFEELVRFIAKAVRSKARIVHFRPAVASWLCKLLGYAVGDVLLTGEEIRALMAGLLVSQSPPTGQARLSSWLEENADQIGTKYASELDRHYRVAK
jgi:NADH dehydrogenase